jgi:plasmid stabilization system protein ParE
MLPVVFSHRAADDLEAIADFIAQDTPARAVAFLQKLRQQCLNIGRFPNAQPRFPELGDRARVMPYKNYVVLYQVLDDAVSIERIIHGARDILSLIHHDGST